MSATDWANAEKHQSELVLRCQRGHEWIEYITLPMSMTAFGSRLKGINCCPTCSDRHVGMLQGKARAEAKARLKS